MTVNKIRDNRIDILRTVGTLLVILAHVNAPENLQFFRSFDVCLLILISGVCCSFHEGENYFLYLKKRLKRLVIPSWITATLIFIIAAALCVVSNREYLYDIKQILETYLISSRKLTE